MIQKMQDFVTRILKRVKIKKDVGEVPIGNVVEYKGRCATFQASMKLTIIIGQCFGLNPVLGVCDIDTSKLRFKYLSVRCVYTIVTILIQMGMFFLALAKFFKDPNSNLKAKRLLVKETDGLFCTRNPDQYEERGICRSLYPSVESISIVAISYKYSQSGASLVFYTINTMTTVLFLRLASKWPRLCQHISRTEVSDPNMDVNVMGKCKMACLLVLFFALVEHALSDLAGIVLIIDCESQEKQVENFIKHSFPGVFDIISYNHFTGFLAQFVNVQFTFNWNFADVFVICISLYLTSRLQQVTKRIENVKGKYVSSMVWRALREDYNRVTSLVRKIDEAIGSIIFISFANNMFFICVQMRYTLADGLKPTPSCQYPDIRPFRGLEHPIYFLYSLLFLMIRSLVMCLITARIHTVSREPLYSLYEVPSPIYCAEVQRFIDQIQGESVALSGLQFFKVNRGMVLTIAGTIVTYELVLLQFAGVTPTVAASGNQE